MNYCFSTRLENTLIEKTKIKKKRNEQLFEWAKVTAAGGGGGVYSDSL